MTSDCQFCTHGKVCKLCEELKREREKYKDSENFEINCKHYQSQIIYSTFIPKDDLKINQAHSIYECTECNFYDSVLNKCKAPDNIVLPCNTITCS